MRTFARIDAGVVAELVTTADDISTLFHPGLRWMDLAGHTVATETGAGRSVAVGDRLAGDGFAAPPPSPQTALPTLAQLRAEIAALAARLAELTGTGTQIAH